MAKIWRPSKYLNHAPEEWRKIIDNYLEWCVDTEEALTDQFWNVKSYITRVNIPSVEGFCWLIKIDKNSFYDWTRKHEIFLYALREIKSQQAQRLLNKGLWWQYNTWVVTRMLAANHWYADKQETKVDQTTKTIPASESELDEALTKLQEEKAKYS